MKKKNILRWIPGILVSFLVIYFISRVVDLNTLINSIRQINFGTIILMAVITIISLGARAVVWMKLLPNVKFFDAFFVTNESYLFNNLIPRSGEIIKAILFAEPAGKSALEVISSVIVERSIDLIIAASMFLITFPFISSLESVRPVAVAFLLLFGIFLTVCFFVAMKSELVKKWLSKIGKRNQMFREKVIPKVEMIIDGFQVLTDLKQFSSVLLWILITWSLWTIILIIGLSSISPDFKFWWAIFTEGMLALGIALPSAPAGLGVYEGTMVAALSAFGVQAEKSLGIAVVIHLIQITLTSIFGVVGVVKQGDSISSILSRIRVSKNRAQEESEE